MKKEDLKPGYVVELRDKSYYICAQCKYGLTLNNVNGGFIPVSNYNEDLINGNEPGCDIIRIWGFCETKSNANAISSRNRPLLWERKEETVIATDDDVLNAIIDVNGDDFQLGIAMEECAELIQAISKYRRYGDNYQSVAEEIADVLMVIEQVKRICNLTDASIDLIRAEKMNRLRGRLASGNNK